MVPTSTAAPRRDTSAAVPATVAPRPVAPKPAGTPILPTGARYGDHNPNVPGRIVRVAAPSIKMDTDVYEVYGINGKWEVADYAAGHHYNSRNPGDGGNIVLSGHNNWRGEVFRDLEHLKPGDEIRVWTQAGKQYVYKVRKIDKLKEVGVSYAQRLKNAQVLNDTSQEQLTLITCWPYTTFTHRLIVIADPVAK
ncbi:MAG: sortase [Chloroflexota bacterium]|nr:sortase [Chloroflexota bacterium]